MPRSASASQGPGLESAIGDAESAVATTIQVVPSITVARPATVLLESDDYVAPRVGGMGR